MEDQTLGWDAIQSAVEATVPAQDPLHWGTNNLPGGPITGSPDTSLTALAFAEDPALSTIDTPHGTVQFLTVVGITGDELSRAKASSTADVLDGLGPLLVTDPTRSS